MQRRDELATQLTVEQANLAALRSNQKALESSYKLIGAQEQELRAGMLLTEIGIRDAELHSPIDGTVLNLFRHEGELAAVGSPLLEVADLSTLRIEVYVPLAMLGSLRLGAEASVSGEGLPGVLKGTVSWIASEAEFTPKTILTQETRTTLVYRVRVLVPNPRESSRSGCRWTCGSSPCRISAPRPARRPPVARSRPSPWPGSASPTARWRRSGTCPSAWSAARSSG